MFWARSLQDHRERGQYNDYNHQMGSCSFVCLDLLELPETCLISSKSAQSRCDVAEAELIVLSPRMTGHKDWMFVFQATIRINGTFQTRLIGKPITLCPIWKAISL